jgi:hypothetical protein
MYTPVLPRLHKRFAPVSAVILSCSYDVLTGILLPTFLWKERNSFLHSARCSLAQQRLHISISQLLRHFHTDSNGRFGGVDAS